MAVCRLCGEDKKLIDAHIIPRSFYPPKAAEGDAVLIPGLEGKEHPRRVPIGVYDTGILCADCDKLLGELDQHAAENLLKAKPAITHVGNGRRYDDADADLILRFVASVAWRASVSSHMMFRAVDLGPYEDAILAFLKDPNAGCPVDVLVAEFDVESPPFLNPHSTRFSGVRFLVIYASRFIFYVKVDKQRTPTGLHALALESGKPLHAVVRQWRTSKEAALMRRMIDMPFAKRIREKWAARRAK